MFNIDTNWVCSDKRVMHRWTFVLFLTLASYAFAESDSDIATLQKRAESGDAKGQYELAISFIGREELSKDNEDLALKWMTKSAEQGYVDAEFRLGAMCDMRGNHAEAEQWFTKAAKKGNSPSALMLFYHYGKGFNILGAFIPDIKQDQAAATKWIIKAVENNDSPADEQLGMEQMLSERYEKGLGVKKDIIESEKWLILACSYHNPTNAPGPQTERSRLEKQLSPEQIKEAQKRADDWDHSHKRRQEPLAQ